MIFNSIRWRLQAWHGLILVLVLAGFGFTAYHVARVNQLRRIDQELDQRLMALFRPPPPPEQSTESPHRGHFGPTEFLDHIREAVQKAGSTESGQTNAFYYVLWQSDGSVLARSPGAPPEVPVPPQDEPMDPNAPAREEAGKPVDSPGEPHGFSEPHGHSNTLQLSFGVGSSRRPSQARTRGQFRESFRFLPRGQSVLVGRSLATDLAAMHRLALWLAAAGGSVLLLGLAGGWWVASRAIRPIEDISATAMKIAAGDLSQRINAADTESELGRLASVLNSTFARLEAAFAHQSRFTSDASHELRTPVSVILSQTQSTLARERNPAEYREALEACQRAAQRMRSLTESLLELARLDAGQEPMKRERFDLARVARESVEMIRPLATERGVELRCELPQVECVGDAERIGQVATNLLTNAIQAHPARGEVRITTQADNGSALLTVSDTGEGIPAEDLPHIFERFYRVDKSRSRAQGRTGLGLAISKAIVDAHGGGLEVISQPGVGSRFQLRLPIN